MSIQAPDMTKDELAEILSLYSNKRNFSPEKWQLYDNRSGKTEGVGGSC